MSTPTMLSTPKEVKFQYGKHHVTLQTGEIARQATAAVLINMDDTVVLVTVVGVEGVAKQSFFPLRVDYLERTSAAGRIPGNYFRREAKPSEKEVLTSRLIDRPVRPLFPEGFMNEVQVIATVLSLNPEVNPDIPALIGASAALSISGLPFNGPLGAARVGYIDGQYILNPSAAEVATSALDLVVAGTKNAVLMVESEAKELSEDVMLEAVIFGHTQMQTAIHAINELAKMVNPTPLKWEPAVIAHTILIDKVAGLGNESLTTAYQLPDKSVRKDEISRLRQQIENDLLPEGEFTKEQIHHAFAELEYKIVRERILAGHPRIDGRDTKTVRKIAARVGVLPRTHGSALFTRGETQALVVTTLGTEADAQRIDALEGEFKDLFMFHYNFPPFSVGEAGMMGSPKRREVGHGRLAKRAVQAMLPTLAEFPYVIRVISDITESNGSSSMASVCGASLSLMDAGVPIKAPVAGIAMGLIKEGSQYAVLTDILGDEDHLGDMDFKVAGTATGITALQMDIKIEGINREIMHVALEQAHKARLHILDLMNGTLREPRTDVSSFAPRITTIKIHPDKIRDLIGKGGAVIRALTEETGTTIDISDDGTVKVAAITEAAGLAALQRIKMITAEPEIGTVYEGTVVKIVEFGAFVNFLPNKDGLVHISEISQQRVGKVEDVLSEGQHVKVKVLEVDRQGRVRLSIKEVATEE